MVHAHANSLSFFFFSFHNHVGQLNHKSAWNTQPRTGASYMCTKSAGILHLRPALSLCTSIRMKYSTSDRHLISAWITQPRKYIVLHYNSTPLSAWITQPRIDTYLALAHKCSCVCHFTSHNAMPYIMSIHKILAYKSFPLFIISCINSERFNNHTYGIIRKALETRPLHISFTQSYANIFFIHFKPIRYLHVHKL